MSGERSVAWECPLGEAVYQNEARMEGRKILRAGGIVELRAGLEEIPPLVV